MRAHNLIASLELKIMETNYPTCRFFSLLCTYIYQTKQIAFSKNKVEHFPAAIQPLFTHQAELNLTTICTPVIFIVHGFGMVHFS
jgi:hypothetical protein